MKADRWPLGLVVLATFLAPLLGGYLPVDPSPVTGGLLAALTEPTGAILAQALIFGLAAIALIGTLVSRKVITVPQPKVSLPFGLALLLVAFSVPISGMVFTALPAMAYWWGLGLVILATVATVGRQKGPVAVIGALAASGAILALIGIREYADQIDPNWRIFSLWVNPNALAGMLVIALFAAVGVAAVSDRLGVLLGSLAGILIVTALLLTASKGGLLAAGVGVAVLVVLSLVWRAGPKLIGILAVCGALGFGLSFALGSKLRSDLAAKSPTAAPAVNSRLGSGDTAEQSQGFRTLLWRGAAQLMQTQPLGRGIGTYRYHSAKPGLTTTTVTAHQSFLQFGVEAGALALLALVIGGILALRAAFAGTRVQPPATIILKVAVLAALFAAGAHNFVDSDLYHLGTGYGLFLLIGLALLLSVDGVVPEYNHRQTKIPTLVAAAVLPFLLVYFGAVEVGHGQLAAAAQAQDAAGARAALESLKGMAPSDPRVPLAEARLGAPNQIALLERAAAGMPTPSVYRNLARLYAQAGNLDKTREALNRALRQDPNNLLALGLAMEIDPDQAATWAERLLKVEETPYFQVRSLPELVPTETYAARLYLAKQDPKRAAELLPAALKGYAEYAAKTVPMVIQGEKAGMGGYAGETTAQATQTMNQALEAASLYSGGAEFRPAFEAALRSLSESVVK